MSTANQTPPAQPKRLPGRRFASARTIFALIIREMATRYGRSPGGYVWAILEPLGVILVLAFAYSLLLRSPPLGSSFVLFKATGYLPFNLYVVLSAAITASIRFSKPLLQYPAVSWIDAVLGRFILNSLTGIIVTYVLLSAVLFFTNTNTQLDFQPILTALLLAMVLGGGVGALNCVLAGLYPLYGQIWVIATRPLMLFSAIIYIYEELPPLAAKVLWYNPLVHITGLMRSGFYPTYNPQYISIPYALFFGMICMGLGFVMMRRFHREILNRP